MMDNTEIQVRLTEHESRIGTLEKQYAAIQDLATSVAVMAQKLNTLDANVGGLVKSVENIKELPSKRWEAIISAAIGAIVGGLLSYFFIKV